MHNIIRYCYIIIISCSLTACGQSDITSYNDNEPTLDIRSYLNGKLTAHGIIFDYSGTATRHFTASIDGSWNGNTGTLDEAFLFSDGATDKRIWTLQFSDDHHFTGTAADVVGTAHGTQHGNALNFHYTLRHTLEDGDTIDLHADDWMYLTGDGVLINKTILYKLGIPVSELIIAFTKEDVS